MNVRSRKRDRVERERERVELFLIPPGNTKRRKKDEEQTLSEI